MAKKERRKGWVRAFIEFALDQDAGREIEQQKAFLQANPRSAKAHFNLAVLHYSQRRVDNAIAECEAAIECDPSFAPAYRKLGEIFIARGQYDLAEQFALKAAELGDTQLLEMFKRYPDSKATGDPRKLL